MQGSICLRLAAYQDDVVGQDVDLLPQTGLLLHLCDFVKGVAHDGDQHVKECDLSNEGREGKEAPNERVLSSHLEVIHVELSERQHVLVEDGIKDIDAEEILEDLTISPLVENEQSVGEGD